MRDRTISGSGFMTFIYPVTLQLRFAVFTGCATVYANAISGQHQNFYSDTLSSVVGYVDANIPYRFFLILGYI